MKERYKRSPNSGAHLKDALEAFETAHAYLSTSSLIVCVSGATSVPFTAPGQLPSSSELGAYLSSPNLERARVAGGQDEHSCYSEGTALLCSPVLPASFSTTSAPLDLRAPASCAFFVPPARILSSSTSRHARHGHLEPLRLTTLLQALRRPASVARGRRRNCLRRVRRGGGRQEWVELSRFSERGAAVHD